MNHHGYFWLGQHCDTTAEKCVLCVCVCCVGKWFFSSSEEWVEWIFCPDWQASGFAAPESVSWKSFQMGRRSEVRLMSKAVWGSSKSNQAHLSAFWWGKSSSHLSRLLQQTLRPVLCSLQSFWEHEERTQGRRIEHGVSGGGRGWLFRLKCCKARLICSISRVLTPLPVRKELKHQNLLSALQLCSYTNI